MTPTLEETKAAREEKDMNPLNDILTACEAIEHVDAQGPGRLVLAGPQWMIDRWKKYYGDSVDYILSEPLTEIT